MVARAPRGARSSSRRAGAEATSRGDEHGERERDTAEVLISDRSSDARAWRAPLLYNQANNQLNLSTTMATFEVPPSIPLRREIRGARREERMSERADASELGRTVTLPCGYVCVLDSVVWGELSSLGCPPSLPRQCRREV